ncbi:MAG TPA: DUF742 domain-containing protein [Actinomycetota bacterium]|jgi:hypothetical protein|nr:DUF742 domain-containing protein [Actinomycetota bacterium]
MDHPEASPPSHPGRLLRPYALTRGRVRPSHGSDLEIEALVSTTVLGESMHMPAPEPHSIALLCREPLSIAEIAAHMKLPIGVVRVLVADMAEQGMVDIHRPSQSGTSPDVTLLERVLDGLRRV